MGCKFKKKLFRCIFYLCKFTFISMQWQMFNDHHYRLRRIVRIKEYVLVIESTVPRCVFQQCVSQNLFLLVEYIEYTTPTT